MNKLTNILNNLNIDDCIKEYIDSGKEIFFNMNYDDRLKLMSFISSVLYNHGVYGGSYRYLIYERFGFNQDAYAILQLSGLLDVHNILSGELKNNY